MALAEKSSLTAKQQHFVEEYLIDLNATRAAMRVEVSRSSARSQGSRLCHTPYVAKAIREVMDCRSRRTAINQDRFLESDFAIGSEDDPWHVIPTEWVCRAQDAWSPDVRRGEMSAQRHWA